MISRCDNCNAPRRFCSPMHSALYYLLMADRLRPDDRCQWFDCRLHKGYHESDCPVRPCLERIRRQVLKWRAESPAETEELNNA